MSFEQSKSEYFGYGSFSCKDLSVDKRELREKLESELDHFFANGGSINELQVGHSGDIKLSKPKEKKKVIKNLDVKAGDVIDRKELKTLKEWCRAKIGRQTRLAKKLGRVQQNISKMILGQKPVTKENYKILLDAMKSVEIDEKVGK